MKNYNTKLPVSVNEYDVTFVGVRLTDSEQSL